jgi:plasmid rolling circle replication initiator protein Rep
LTNSLDNVRDGDVIKKKEKEMSKGLLQIGRLLQFDKILVMFLSWVHSLDEEY